MDTKRWMIKGLRLIPAIGLLTLIVAILASACTLGQNNGGATVVQGSGAQAWIDQPASDATLPLAPFKLKAHATQQGGGITQIIFLANTVPLSTIPTDTSESLVYAVWDWNPVQPGMYNIQARAITASGAVVSDIAHICIASSMASEGACAVLAQEGVTPAAPSQPKGEGKFILSAAPSPVYIGQCTLKEPQSLIVDSTPSDVSGAIEVTARAWIESFNGSRQELSPQAMQKNDKGGYSATFDLRSAEPKFLELQPGKVIYTVSLMNDKKEFYSVSPEQSVSLLLCGGTPAVGTGKVTFKLGAAPDPVYIGSCKKGEPQRATIEGAPSDISQAAEATIKGWLENVSANRVQLFDQAMTKTGQGYTSIMSFTEIDPKYLENKPGKLVFVMSLMNDKKEVYASSPEASIALMPCIYQTVTEAPQQPEQPQPEQPKQPQQPQPEAPPQDTTPPTIKGGGPSANPAYFDPKGVDPKNCQPTSVSFQVNVSDSSGLSYVVVYWYWASTGDPNSAQFAQLSGSGKQYSFTFSPDHGDDTLVYWVKAADVYNNVAQSGSFKFSVASCSPPG